jgi:hypothetical protein
MFTLFLQQGSVCCGYGSKGVAISGYDCVMIPGASKFQAPIGTPVPNSICGNGKGLVTKATDAVSTTVCSK